MKTNAFLFFSIIFLTSCSTTKLNSYGKTQSNSYEKIKTQAELVHLTVTKSKLLKTPSEEIGLQSLIGSEVIIEQLLKLPDYFGKIIKDRKKNYTQSYSAKNTLTFETIKPNNTINNNSTMEIYLPELLLTRILFSKTLNGDGEKALELFISPKLIDGNDTFFRFKLSDVNMTYTKAKTTEKFPFVNLNIVIKCTYYETLDDNSKTEKTITSQSIIVPIKNGMDFTTNFKDYNFNSDPFKIEGLKMVEVEITEVNPYFLKLEEVETNITENKDDLSTILTKLTELIKAKD